MNNQRSYLLILCNWLERVRWLERILDQFIISHPDRADAAVDVLLAIRAVDAALAVRDPHDVDYVTAFIAVGRLEKSLGHVVPLARRDRAEADFIVEALRLGILGDRSQYLYGYLDLASESAWVLRRNPFSKPATASHRRPTSKPARVSRKTWYVTGLAVRQLPPADRARYRQEFASELADLPRRHQAPHAVRLVRNAWSQRRSLTGKPSVQSTRVMLVVGTGAGSAVCLSTMGWPATALGSVVVTAVMWTISSQERTRRLATLIRAVLNRHPPTRKR